VLKAVTAPPTFKLSVARIELNQVDAERWDADAIRCGASMRSAHAHLKRVGLKHVLRGRPQVYQVLLERDGTTVRVGHYTLIRKSGLTSFYDGLNLFPEYSHLWVPAMEAALAQAGAGTFDYGWQWSPEPPRDEAIAAIPGAALVSVRHILIQGVDFANWPDWDSYYRDISENIRRNAKKAEKLHADIRVAVVHGMSALGHVGDLVAMRQAMYRRKHLPFNPLRILAGYVLSFLACPAQAMIALTTGGGRVLAIQNNVEFGGFHYYLDGAAASDTDGGAWHLQLAMLKRAYDRLPTCRFLLGYTDLPVADQAAEGLLRSRRSLRASDWPTSLVRFQWRP
jgi:hypothetical protein